MIKCQLGNGNDKVQYATVVVHTPKHTHTQIHSDTCYILTQQSCLPILLIYTVLTLGCHLGSTEEQKLQTSERLEEICSP